MTSIQGAELCATGSIAIAWTWEGEDFGVSFLLPL